MKKNIKLSSFLTLSIIVGVNLFHTNSVFSQSSKNIAFVERELTQNDFNEIIEVVSGKINISFDIPKEEILASSSFTIKNFNQKPVSKIFFALNSGVKISEINIENNNIKEIIKEKTDDQSLGYVLYLDKPLLVNESINLNISYQGIISAYYKFGRIKDNDIFLTAQTNFYPRFSKLQKSSSIIDLNVRVPDEYLAVSQTEQFSLTKEKGNNLFSGKITNLNGLNNDEGFNLAAAKYKVYTENNISIYHRNEMDKALLEYMIDFETKALSSLKEVFGKHDYDKFFIVEVNRNDLGGMGSANVIYLSDKSFGNYKTNANVTYDYFKGLYKNDENRVNEEFKYYLRNVLAHESTHLFFNYFYSYDKLWFAEGFPEFVSLKVLNDYGNKSDLPRKLADYKKALAPLGNNKLPSLNQAELNSQAGYLINYWGTPLVLYQVWQNNGDKFWDKLANLLNNKAKNITYENFKDYFKFDTSISNSFENSFTIPVSEKTK